jgi:hypothetical protein
MRSGGLPAILGPQIIHAYQTQFQPQRVDLRVEISHEQPVDRYVVRFGRVRGPHSGSLLVEVQKLAPFA